MSIIYIRWAGFMKDNTELDLAIVIVSYNVENYILNCIKSLILDLCETNIRYKIVVVDNNSTDNSVEKIKNNFSNVKLIQNEYNCGFGRAQNIGVKSILAKNYLILNPDTIIQNKIIQKLYMHKIKYEPVVVGCRMFDERNNIQKRVTKLPNLLITISTITNVKKLFIKLHIISFLKLFKKIHLVNDYFFSEEKVSKYECVESVSGSCFLIDGENMRDIGGYDENIFLYYEDDDLFHRILNNKWKIHLISNMGVLHFVEKSSVGNKQILILHKNWSILYYYNKHRMFIQYNTVRFVLLLISTFHYIASKYFIKDKKLEYLYKKIILFSFFGVHTYDPFTAFYNNVQELSGRT